MTSKNVNGRDLNFSQRGLFERPEASFESNPLAIEWILDDPANPLNHIVKFIREDAEVLDIGAGNGILALLLNKLKREVKVDAVEPDIAARQRINSIYREVYGLDLEAFLRQDRSRQYDYIVMADVIEHIANPEPLLKLLKQLLKPGGKIILSTPNVAFASVRLALLYGKFDYVDSGILEKTHLRFYTRKTILKLFDAAQLNVETELHCKRNPFSCEIPLGGLTFSYRLMNLIGCDPLSWVYQFVFVLTKERPENTVHPNKVGLQEASLPLLFLKTKIRALLNLFKCKLRHRI